MPTVEPAPSRSPQPRVRRVLAAAMLAAAGLVSSGCGEMAVRLRAVEPVNLNEEGESGSVAVRIYQLKDGGRFAQADAAALWLDDRAALGDDRLADPLTVVLRPGPALAAPRVVELGKPAAGTRWIGVLAMYPAGAVPPPGERQRAVLERSEAEDGVFELSGRRLAVVAR